MRNRLIGILLVGWGLLAAHQLSASQDLEVCKILIDYSARSATIVRHPVGAPASSWQEVGRIYYDDAHPMPAELLALRPMAEQSMAGADTGSLGVARITRSK